MFGVIFKDFSDRSYLKQKIAAHLRVRDSNYWNSDTHLDYWASVIEARHLELPLADSKSVLAAMPAPMLKSIQAKMNNMLGHISRQYPLVADEVVLDDTFTFFTADYASFTKATPLLIRKTSKATMVHVFNNLEFSDGDIVFRPQPDREGVLMASSPGLVGGPATIIVSLFSGMAKAIGGKIGSQIFDTVFPKNSTDMEAMLAALQDNIQQIFRQELDDQTITNLNYQIQGLISYMQETYTPLKAAGKERTYLEQILEAQNQKLYTETMALLVGERYRAKGIAYLVVGANAHLSILQEMANIDPNCDVPAKSSYMTTYRMRLADYISALDSAINEVNSNRLTFLGPLKESTMHGAADEYWYFKDGWADYTSPHYHNTSDCCDYDNDAKKKATDARNKYDKETFSPTIVTDLQPYRDTKTAWVNVENAK